MKDQLVNVLEMKEKESQMKCLKPFFEAEQRQSFWSFITKQQNIRMNYTCLSDPVSVYVHMCVHTPTHRHAQWDSHTLPFL